ncbi:MULTISPECIES: helix-turn-helix domain-containing protein [Caproicibacterium]|uniref:helix-turn-helix domain-containing protein n=1 Tax=Caproicibacterium TaxID=2834348 RepID=UPI0038996525
MRYVRLEHDLPQQQLADYLHLDRSAVAYIETGRTPPSLQTLVQAKANLPPCFLGQVPFQNTSVNTSSFS